MSLAISAPPRSTTTMSAYVVTLAMSGFIVFGFWSLGLALRNRCMLPAASTIWWISCGSSVPAGRKVTSRFGQQPHDQSSMM